MDYEARINQYVLNAPPSGIRKYFDCLSDDVISFGVGEPDFPTPEAIRKPALEALAKGRIAYTSNSGDPLLRELILGYLSERFGLQYPSIDNLLVTVGASQALDLAFRTILNPGDEVIIHEPAYIAYAPDIELAGGVPVSIPTYAKDGFRVTPEKLRAAITPKTKAVLIAFPTNPTGAIMERHQLEPIAEIIKEADLLAVTDEIYAELTFDGRTHCSLATLPGMAERTIVINGFSKAFSMTGWRLGYAAGPAELIAAMRKVHQWTMLSAPTTAQVAGIFALQSGMQADWADVKAMHGAYAERRRVMMEGFAALGCQSYEPLGAFYLFPDIRVTGLSSEEFCDRLMVEKKVICIPGTAFGELGEHHIRCCYATSVEDIKEGLARIGEFIEGLKV
jgi:aminotransferase